ncbi:MAG: FAD-dependent oxidoreductase, partial [Anaerolineales bacterium]|nr:FAD-dependent oxidoreductase [Anaerolineales bacterium]
MTKTAIVIGAGLAGLSAALDLHRAGCRVSFQSRAACSKARRPSSGPISRARSARMRPMRPATSPDTGALCLARRAACTSPASMRLAFFSATFNVLLDLFHSLHPDAMPHPMSIAEF